MLVTRPYNRNHAYAYAQRWALSRNALFYDFAPIGGDCTNFASQCLYAGSCMMNYTPTYGWYFISAEDRSASWTGVDFFYNFITQNNGEGPFGRETSAQEILIGDFVQLGRADGTFYHTLVICGAVGNTFLVCAHNNDVLNRRLNTYQYDLIRYLHIDGVRFITADPDNCFESVYNGVSIYPTQAQSVPTPASQAPEAPAPTAQPTETPAPATQQAETPAPATQPTETPAPPPPTAQSEAAPPQAP